MESEKLGILVNNGGYVKIEGMPDVTIIEPEKYRKLPSKSVVKYMLLDRRNNGQIVKTIKINEVNPSGYNVKSLEKISEISREIWALRKSVENSLNITSEEKGQFEICFKLAGNLLEEGKYADANNFIDFSLIYCSEMIFKAPMEKKKFYSETYKKINPLKRHFSGLEALVGVF
ncbi:hypothetical protein J4411_03155 [Candidatus Pacearchaeota archaeon]|nr:hypothetical protein [Candidatus Pacearchaeota archaeon]